MAKAANSKVRTARQARLDKGKPPVKKHNGGKRPGAGRKPRTKKTADVNLAPLPLEHPGLRRYPGIKTPLDLFMAILGDDTLLLETRLDAGKAAAPYIHPKLAPAPAKTDKPAADSARNENESPATPTVPGSEHSWENLVGVGQLQ